MFKRFVFVATLLAAATPALAHTGDHTVSGFLSGIAHPLGGLDHALAMIGVGLFAVLLGGQALWALPLSFVGMMLVGGMLGMSGVEIPAVEFGIVASIVVLGTVVAWGRTWPVQAAIALVGIFAVFHGYAHGTEIPSDSDAVLYSVGFAVATAMLHGAGIAAGLLTFGQKAVTRLAGAAVAVTGVVIALG